MQTFLPYNGNFSESAKVLDNKRLGKQRVETMQLLMILLGEPTKSGKTRGRGWVNHPACLMWKGYERALAAYGKAMCEEWIARGFKDSLLPYFKQRLGKGKIKYPPWYGQDNFHASHRSNLLRKDKIFYGPLGWHEPDNLEYVWPTKENL